MAAAWPADQMHAATSYPLARQPPMVAGETVHAHWSFTDPGLFVEHASAYLRQQWTVDVQHLRAGGKYS